MSYTPFKMAPKGPIMKQMHSAIPKRSKAAAKSDAIKGDMPKAVADTVFAKKGKSPYEYEADGKDFAARKKEEEIKNTMSHETKHGQMNGARAEAENDIKNKNKEKKKKKSSNLELPDQYADVRFAGDDRMDKN